MKRYNRIAIYVQDLDPSHGGIERVTYILSKELTRRGYYIYAIYLDNLPIDRNLYSHYKGIIQGEETYQIIEFIKNHNIEIFLNQISRCYSSVMLQQEIKKKTSVILIDVLHTMPLQLAPLKEFYRPLLIPKFLNRILFGIHKEVNLQPRYRKGNRLSYKLCDAFVMLSPHYFSEFTNDNKIKDNHKLYAIANPFERANYKSLPKEKIVLMVARLNNQQKRIDRTLRFWKNFHQDGDGWKLMIVGDGHDKEMLNRMAKRLGLADYSFEGHSVNPMDYYNRAMLVMMTSDIEGWGMTLIEAMSVGCVPIAMNCFSALPDIVSNGQNGIIVQKDDIPGMITATRYAISHFDEMSANARESVKRFDVETITNKWEELFNQL